MFGSQPNRVTDLLSDTFTCCLFSPAEERSFHRECHFLVGVALSALFTSCFTAVCSVGGATGWSVGFLSAAKMNVSD